VLVPSVPYACHSARGSCCHSATSRLHSLKHFVPFPRGVQGSHKLLYRGIVFISKEGYYKYYTITLILGEHTPAFRLGPTRQAAQRQVQLPSVTLLEFTTLKYHLLPDPERLSMARLEEETTSSSVLAPRLSLKNGGELMMTQ
jgi:hypothetical protein